eukprot:361250-Chlamydomonas_euryale.AAC.11
MHAWRAKTWIRAGMMGVWPVDSAMQHGDHTSHTACDGQSRALTKTTGTPTLTAAVFAANTS